MTVSQQINHIQDQDYDDDITVTDIPKGYFIAVTGVSIQQGSNTRDIRVDLMPAEWAEGGTMTTNSGLYVRQQDETRVHVSVYNGSTLECENTTNYS